MSEKNEWKLVPVVPTDEMEAAAEDDYEQTGATFPRWKSAYAAMLAAAPAPSAPGDAQDERIGTLSRNADETIRFTPARDFHVKDGMPVFSTPAAGDALGGVIAGALFDLMGYLTTLDTPIPLGSTEDAAVAVEILQRWAALRGLNLDNADVEGWAERRSAAIDAALAAQRGKGEAT